MLGLHHSHPFPALQSDDCASQAALKRVGVSGLGSMKISCLIVKMLCSQCRVFWLVPRAPPEDLCHTLHRGGRCTEDSTTVGLGSQLVIGLSSCGFISSPSGFFFFFWLLDLFLRSFLLQPHRRSFKERCDLYPDHVKSTALASVWKGVGKGSQLGNKHWALHPESNHG